MTKRTRKKKVASSRLSFQSLRDVFRSAGIVLSILFLALALPVAHKTYIKNSVATETIMIRSGNGKVSWGGTGFYVKAPSGKVYLMSNAHVCGKAPGKLIHVKRGERLVPRRIIDVDRSRDLCLVEALADQSGVSLSGGFADGDNIHVVGHPYLKPLKYVNGEVIGHQPITLRTGINVTKAQCRLIIVVLNSKRYFKGLNLYYYAIFL